MFDIGFSELLVIGVVALIVVGPKDLPMMFHTLGRFTARARQLAREFSRALEAAADESGVKDVANDLKNVTSPKAMGLDKLRDAADKFEKWSPSDSGRSAAAKEESEEQSILNAQADAEAQSWETADAEPEPAKKPAARKPAAKKTGTRKTGAASGSKSAAAKTPAAKTAAKKAPAPKSAPKKTTAAKSAPKSAPKAASKTASKSGGTKKTAAKKTDGAPDSTA